MNIKKIISKPNLKFIVFRTDRIGDTVLSTQVPELIKQKFPDSSVTFVARKYTKSLFNNNPFVDEVLAIDDYSEKEFLELLKSKKFDVSIALYSAKITAKLPFLANVPVRIGPMSKIYGVLYNVRMWQKRSRSIKNEAEYNMDLLKPLGITDIAYPKLYLTDEEIEFGRQYFGVRVKSPIILHPGSGGSSKDWPLENYFELARKLKENGKQIFITGAANELNFYREKFNVDENDLMKEELNMRKFLGVINQASVFISNSTGPLHCASALGKKTISFYPPLKTCKALRWGPFAKDKAQNFVFSPDLSECQRCETSCKYYLCMEDILVEDVLDKVLKIALNFKT